MKAEDFDLKGLASRAEFAALVVANENLTASELLFLDDEPSRDVCRGLTERGWSPVALIAMVPGEGLRLAFDRGLLERNLPTAFTGVMRGAAIQFLAATTQRKPEDRTGTN